MNIQNMTKVFDISMRVIQTPNEIRVTRSNPNSTTHFSHMTGMMIKTVTSSPKIKHPYMTSVLAIPQDEHPTPNWQQQARCLFHY